MCAPAAVAPAAKVVTLLVALTAWLHDTSCLLGQETAANGSLGQLSATSNDTSLLQDLQRRLEAQELEIQRLKTNAVRATYDNGFLFQTSDPDAVPFQLKVNGRMQLSLIHILTLPTKRIV